MVTHRFHIDRHGDSVTVFVYTGLGTGDAEMLVNGKEVALGKLDHSKGCELVAELPTSPPTPVHAAVRWTGRGAQPECTLLIGGVEQSFEEISADA